VFECFIVDACNLGGFLLLNKTGSKILSTTLKDGEVSCFMCSKVMLAKRVHDHVAAHILAVLYGHPHKELALPVRFDNFVFRNVFYLR